MAGGHAAQSPTSVTLRRWLTRLLGSEYRRGASGFSVANSCLSLMGLASILETVGGLLRLLGLFTGPAALLLAVEMAAAYVMARAPAARGRF